MIGGIVDAALVPGGDLDAETIEDGAGTLRGHSTSIRQASSAVAQAWQGLGACYETPHTDQLLRSLDPVTATAHRIADDLDEVAAVLVRFAEDVRSLAAQRTTLVGEITRFRERAPDASMGGLGQPEALDPQQSFENTSLLNRSRLLGEQFETAEQECADKIKAIGSPAGLLEQVGNWFTDTWNQTVAAGSEAWDGLTDAVEDLGDALADAYDDAADWTTARADDVAGWVGDRADTIGRSWNTFDEAITAIDEAVKGTPDDPRPQLTAVGASYLQYLGAGADALLTTITLGTQEIDLADDGDPWAGTPIKYDKDDPLDGQKEPIELRDVEDLLASVTRSYETNEGLGKDEGGDYSEGYVRVTKVIPPDGGEPTMVVSIPGTQPWFPMNDSGNEHPADLIGNLVRAGGGRTTYSDSVGLALDQMYETDPSLKGASVMLVGHSQGGMTAADLASDEAFVQEHHVTDVVTFGSPIANDRFTDGVHVLELAHESDIVPKLDLNDARLDPQIKWTEPIGSLTPARPYADLTSESEYRPDPATHTSVALPDPKSAEDAPFWEKPNEWHSHENYYASVKKLSGPGSVIDEYQNQIGGSSASEERAFLHENSTFETYDVPVKRIN